MVPTSPFEDDGVFDRAGDQPRSVPAPGVREAIEGCGESRRAAAVVEGDLTWAHAEIVGEDGPGLVEQGACLTGFPVKPAGIRPTRVEGSDQGLAGLRMERPGGGVEQARTCERGSRWLLLSVLPNTSVLPK